MVTSAVKDGYEQIEVGIIPEDWDVVRIGDHFDFKNGLNKEKRYFGFGTPIVNYMDVYTHTGIKLTDIMGKVSVSKGELLAYEVRKGDVFFTRTSETVDEIGLSSVILEDVKNTVFSGFLLRARPKTDYFDLQFKKYCFRSAIVRKQIMSMSCETTRALTNGKQLSSVIMLVPKNKKEQSILAQVLSDIDFLIQSFDRLIEKKKNIKQGTMQELLKGTNRLQGSWETKEGKKWTPLGQIPEDWDVKKLGEIAYITKLAGYEYSKYFNSYKDSGDIIVIRGTNITNNKLDLSDVRTIPKSTSEKLPRSKLFANDLVFAYVGTIGPVFLIEDNDRYHLGPNTCKIVAEKTVVPKFLFCYFTSWLINKEIAEQISIGAQPSLSMSKIRNFDLIVPGSIDEQNAIAEVLTDMTKEIEALECQRDKYRQVKSGMMQQLLTGRIRLTCKN